jgi:antitoxin (DNA-binding transcriptional repressor) of toxin-antitoxin stability system
MSELVISVTEAARNFADCINRARYQGTTFVLQKNGVSVARIVPEEQKSCSALELATALAKAHLSDEEFASWRRDLKAAREILLPPVDKWQS